MQAKGVLSAASDSPSTLSILLEHVTRSAAAQRVALHSSAPRVHAAAARHVLSLLHARLCYAQSLRARAEVAAAAKEVLEAVAGAGPAGGEGGGEGGSLLQELAAAGAGYARHLGGGGGGGAAKALEALEGLALDNFVDIHRLQGGRDVAGRLGALRALVGGGRYVQPGGAEAAAAFMES